MKKKFFLILVVCCHVVWGTPAVVTLHEANAAEIIDRILAVVNDDIITLYDLNKAMEPFVDRLKSFEYSDEEERQMLLKIKRDILNQLINQKLTDQEINRFNIFVSDEEIDQAIDRIKSLRGYTDDDLKTALARDGISLEEYREKVKENLLRTKLINLEVKSKVVITNEDIAQYFQAHQGEYGGGEKYHLRNIIIRVSPSADESEKQAAQKKINEIVNRFKKGTPFGELARRYSESLLAEDDGDLGLFKFDDISLQLQNALKGLKAGDITPIIDTDQGYQIFYVDDIKTDPGKALEEVSLEIQEKLYNEIVESRFQSWLEDLRNRSHIEIMN